MLKVIFFVPCFASGGAEAFVVNTIEKLDRNIFEPIVLSIDQHDTVYDKRLERAGAKRKVLLDKYIKNPVRRYLLAYKLFGKYIKNNSENISAIHFNIAQGEELPFIQISKKAGVKIRIMHSHNSDVSNTYKYYGHVFCKILFGNSATSYCACSDIAAKWLMPAKILKSKNYAVIKNGIDTKKYAFNFEVGKSKRRELNIENKTVYLNIGRLEEQKNQKFLLRVYREICEKQSNSVLLIAGEGSLKNELKKLAIALNLKDKVIWLGNRTDIPELLCAADIFLLPSLYEGSPFTLIEAQTSGIPCVISENISEQCVLTDLVKRVPLDIEIYSNAVLDVCNSFHPIREDYFGRMVKYGFDIENTVKTLERYYVGEM